MSETEAWIGKAKVIKAKDGEDLEGLCQRLCEESRIEKSSYHESYQEALADESYKTIVIVDGVVYDTSDKKELDYEYMCEASYSDDETIEFQLVFYNGGTCFTEMLEDAVKKAKSKLNG